MNAIAETNDRLRKNIPLIWPPHRLVLTRRVASMPEDLLKRVFEAVRAFDNFNRDNDPYHEHDCGIVDVDGDRFIWKFNYYDDDFEFFRENGNRVLTIMHASEY